MAIPTSRTNQRAEIKIHSEKCTGCGLCVSVCKDFGLVMKNKKVHISDDPIFACIGCGHCMAICNAGAIEIHGRTLSPDQLFELPEKRSGANFEQLFSLLQRRRSIREFKDKDVGEDLLEKILFAAKTAPMGLPPSDVNVLVIAGKDKTREFANDFCLYLAGMKWFVSNWFLALMRPFWGKINDELFREFVKPLFKVYTERMKEGMNLYAWCNPSSTQVAKVYLSESPFNPFRTSSAKICSIFSGSSNKGL